MLKSFIAGIASACLISGVNRAQPITVDASDVTFSGVEHYLDIPYSTSALG
jgi:hypothetical protein